LAAPLSQSDIDRHRRIVGLWLLILCALVFVMIMIGGLTRLTHSGLSMVEWRPVTGWAPPATEADWQTAFEKYQNFPEYKKLNRGMSLGEFKDIFWLEFAHRLWGRIIGLAFMVPFVILAVKGIIHRPWLPKLALAFLLGSLQGVLGWYMVKSGLIDRPDISQYRLVAHLGAALMIMGYLLWLALDFLAPPREDQARGPAPLYRFARMIMTLVTATILAGGFVAGLDAGFAYNTFPLMDGQIIPAAAFASDPWYRSFFEDIATVQFEHRVLAMATLIAVAVFWIKSLSASMPKRATVFVHCLMAVTALQVVLGIATLVLEVPIVLALLHQANAIVAFCLVVWVTYELHPQFATDG
jgi:cytochrome c oxidase assembly protein subunit 15